MAGLGGSTSISGMRPRTPRPRRGGVRASSTPNGDGVITPGWTEPTEAIDPSRDHRIRVSCYSPAVNPADGTVWCSGNGPTDNRLVRIDLGENPPASCTAELFEPPPGVTNPSAYGSGGLHFTTDGIAWQDWRGSGHFASFDRNQCADTTDPEATGQSCPEGWTFHRIEKPTYQNAEFPINSDESYLTQIDHYNVLGLGRDVPLYGAVNTDSLEVFIPQTGGVRHDASAVSDGLLLSLVERAHR